MDVLVIFKMFRKKVKIKIYDPEQQKPVLRCSICTGEQTAGFIDKGTGHFEDIMLIRNEEDLEEFRYEYGITGDIERIY